MNFDTYKCKGRIYHEIKNYLHMGYYTSAIEIIIYHFYPIVSNKIKDIDKITTYLILNYIYKNPRIRYLIKNDIAKIIFDIGIILKVNDGMSKVTSTFFSDETKILCDFFCL
jgi:hypothetical protein